MVWVSWYYLFADGSEVGVESALESEQQLHVVVGHNLQGLVDRRDVEGDRLKTYQYKQKNKQDNESQ